MNRTHAELTKIVRDFVTGYLDNHPHALFLVECDQVAVSAPTTDVDEIVYVLLSYDHTTLYCMAGDGSAKEIRFDWESGFKDGGLAYQCILASVEHCDDALKPFWQQAAR